jgi:transcriptional regulator with PAS, ATPase and Fis domain
MKKINKNIKDNDDNINMDYILKLEQNILRLLEKYKYQESVRELKNMILRFELMGKASRELKEKYNMNDPFNEENSDDNEK